MTETDWYGRRVEDLRRRWGVPQLVIHARIDSSNDAARRLAAAGAEAGTTVIADAQDAGRGRLGRTWHGRPGASFLASMVLRPKPAQASNAAGALPLRIGLEVARALERVTGIGVALKWPNDLLIDGRKVAGILCEAATDGGTAFVIAGVGINVAQTRTELPAPLRASATSLLIATGRPLTPADVADSVIPALLALAGSTLAPLQGDVAAAIAMRDACRDAPIRVVTAEAATPVSGIGAGIEPDGALRVRAEHGAIVRVVAGTVRFAQHPSGTPGRTA